MATNRTIATLAWVLLALGAGGCSGGSGGATSPTAPAGGPAVALATEWGELVVRTHGHPVDLDRAYASVVAGFDKGRSQIGPRVDRFRLDGYVVDVKPPDWGLAGEHVRDRREIRMRAGVEHVLEHEIQHFLAWELDRFAECKAYQDHAGGFDLHCRPLP